MAHQSTETIIRDLIIQLGEDADRTGLSKTPARVARMYDEILSGYTADLESLGTTFPAEGQDLITVAAIPFYSLCEHHMLPFFGKAYIGYVPDKKILGLSKFARIVDVFAKRLQVQERLTHQIGEALESILEPLGLIVHLDAEHMCMSMRGVKKPGAITQTEIIRGKFQQDQTLYNRFYTMIKRN